LAFSILSRKVYPMPPAQLNQLLQNLRSENADVRFAAWRSAGPAGAAAIAPIADIMAATDKAAVRSATEALQRVTHYSARPAASKNERRAVALALLQVANSPRPRMVRAEALYQLGFVAEEGIVPALARLLDDKEVREDARMALERIPGTVSLRALEEALRRAPADFQPNLRQAINNRRAINQAVNAAGATRR
jgi:HEAT repeat protein